MALRMLRRLVLTLAMLLPGICYVVLTGAMLLSGAVVLTLALLLRDVRYGSRLCCNYQVPVVLDVRY